MILHSQVFKAKKMEIPSTFAEQTNFKIRHETDEHLLNVRDIFFHEKKFFQPLKTVKKHFKIIVTFLTTHKVIFNITFLEKQIIFLNTNYL